MITIHNALLMTKLAEITGNSKVEMAWENYEDKIVLEHSVELTGWPKDIKFNPGHLGNKQLERIQKGIDAGIIKWRKLGDVERAQRGEARFEGINNGTIKTKARAPRADKGVKRGPRKAKGKGKGKSSEVVDSDEDMEDNEEEEEEEAWEGVGDTGSETEDSVNNEDVSDVSKVRLTRKRALEVAAPAPAQCDAGVASYPVNESTMPIRAVDENIPPICPANDNNTPSASSTDDNPPAKRRRLDLEAGPLSTNVVNYPVP
ncbi:MAG TPA: hypothetical protein VGO47_02360 [Chlamydiales bacterium]|nr:hypothetical protein [Chlamydiales bacterium]